MTIFDFTVEETSLIAIYKGGTRMETLITIAAAYPNMGADFTAIAESASRKLADMSDADYNAADFTIPGDEGEGGFDEDGGGEDGHAANEGDGGHHEDGDRDENGDHHADGDDLDEDEGGHATNGDRHEGDGGGDGNA